MNKNKVLSALSLFTILSIAGIGCATQVVYEVSFDTTGCDESFKTQIVKKGEKAVNPGKAKKSSHPEVEFVCWNNKNIQYNFDLPVESNLTLTPVFKNKTFTVTFDTTGFTTTYPSQTVEINGKAKNPGFPIPSNPDLRCYGWNLDGKYFDFDNTPIIKNITLKPATTTYVLDVEGISNVDIESTSPITYGAKKGGIPLTEGVEWSTANKIVQIDKNTGTITIPTDCKGGIDYIIAKYSFAEQDYYGSLPISVASFNKLDSTKLNNHIAAKANDNIAGKIIIPNIIYDNSHKEIKINNMDEGAFLGCSNITSVISLGEYKSIPNAAFKGCSKLENFAVGNHVESIGSEAFRNCVCLEKIVIAKSINSIGEYAFAGTALTEAIFENPEGWFYSSVNSYPISIDILNNASYAGYLLSYYFNNASWGRNSDVLNPLVNFDNITLEYNDSYRTSAILFSNQKVNYRTDTPQTITVNENGLVTPTGVGTGYGNVYAYNEKGITLCGIKIVDDKYIAPLESDNNNIYATSKAKSDATNITLPDRYISNKGEVINIKGITNRGFYETKKLAYMYIPDFIETIGNEAFAYDSNVIPETSLRNVLFTIESKCNSIGDSCFRNCNKLESINLPANLTNLGAGAFEDCASLISITLGDKLTEIKDNTFKGCSKLKGLYIPKNVNKIGDHIFAKCSLIENVYYGGTVAEFTTALGTHSLGDTSKPTYLNFIHCVDGDFTVNK